MRLEIEESVFLSGHGCTSDQYLIWPRDFPQSILEKLTLDQSYTIRCEIENQGSIIFVGEAFIKRRQQSGPADVLVVMVSEIDLGKLIPAATIELDLGTLN